MILDNLKRVSFDVMALLSIFLIALFVPESVVPVDAKQGLLAIFVTKFLLVSAGIAHAHITRKLLWPYIKFEKEAEWSNNLMIIAWYVTVLCCWARGG
jgi:hypothetical protein